MPVRIARFFPLAALTALPLVACSGDAEPPRDERAQASAASALSSTWNGTFGSGTIALALSKLDVLDSSVVINGNDAIFTPSFLLAQALGKPDVPSATLHANVPSFESDGYTISPTSLTLDVPNLNLVYVNGMIHLDATIRGWLHAHTSDFWDPDFDIQIDAATAHVDVKWDVFASRLVPSTATTAVEVAFEIHNCGILGLGICNPQVHDRLEQKLKGTVTDLANNALTDAFAPPAPGSSKIDATKGFLGALDSIANGLNGVDRNDPFPFVTDPKSVVFHPLQASFSAKRTTPPGKPTGCHVVSFCQTRVEIQCAPQPEYFLLLRQDRGSTPVAWDATGGYSGPPDMIDTTAAGAPSSTLTYTACASDAAGRLCSDPIVASLDGAPACGSSGGGGGGGNLPPSPPRCTGGTMKNPCPDPGRFM